MFSWHTTRCSSQAACANARCDQRVRTAARGKRASAKAGEWYSFPGDNSLRITERIQGLLQEVVTLRRTPEQAMRQMTEIVQQLLPK